MKNKIKTKKSALKRIKISGKGKLTRYKAGMRHLLEHKNSNKKRKQRLKQNDVSISKADEPRIKKMLGQIK
ncbi:MAG: 50S ribosomal protein L35 [bacterium]